MVSQIEEPKTIIPADIFVPAYELIHGVEDKIKAAYNDAEFQLLCGPEEALHLKVYVDASMWDVMELVRSDLLSLREQSGLCLYVVPIGHEDREDGGPPTSSNGRFS